MSFWDVFHTATVGADIRAIGRFRLRSSRHCQPFPVAATSANGSYVGRDDVCYSTR